MSPPRAKIPKAATDAIVAATIADPDLSAQARSLGALALSEVERIFREGHHSERAALVRVMLPAMMKDDKETEGDEMAEMRKDLAKVMKEAGLG